MEDTPPSTSLPCASEVDGDEFFDALQGSPVRVMMVGGKRRRLNDDCDDSEVAANVSEDKDCNPASAPQPSAASASPASVLAVYVHNARHFQCTLCSYTASSFASLISHRGSRHRRTAFLDRFSAGCACGQPFASRLAAARHSLACSTLLATSSATTTSAVGASSPAAGPVEATVADAVNTVLPPQATNKVTVSPPRVTSSTSAISSADSEQHPDRVEKVSRWSLPLPRALVASRVADRLGALQPRWDQPLPRIVIAQRIADRLGEQPLSSSTTDSSTTPDLTMEITAAPRGSRTPARGSQSAPPSAHSTIAAAVQNPDVGMPDCTNACASSLPAPGASGEWLLRFDGACRGNPGHGGAGAALFNPSGTVVWTCSNFMSSVSETNNSAEYAALLIGLRAAADHGARTLRVEGDSKLVIEQVRGRCRTLNKRLAAFKKLVQHELRRLDKATLHHIDRQDNAHADRLANRALDAASTETLCGIHPDGGGCTSMEIVWSALHPAGTSEFLDPPDINSEIAGPSDVDMEASTSNDFPLPDIDDGELYLPMSIGGDTIPQRRSRLRLRDLTDDEAGVAAETMQRLGAQLAAKITDAANWDAAEGYITALPYLIYEKLQPFTAASARAQSPPSPHRQHRQPPGVSPTRSGAVLRPATQRRNQQRRRPPRTTPFCRERRLDEALDSLRAVEQNSSSSRKSILKARRKVGRIRKSQRQQLLRHQFGQNEKACVAGILQRARAAREQPAASDTTDEVARTAAEYDPLDPDSCPIPGARLWQHFKDVNTPRTTFDPEAPIGAVFREAMARLPVASTGIELLTEAPSTEDIELQLQRLKPGSSPGLDGVGYDVYKMFSEQLLPALAAAYKCCWDHHRIPLSWKLGTVRLIYKKGDRDDPKNWRPICLQQAIYKIYAGVLAKRFTRWMELNERHAAAQKGFRAVNGCGEHNFVASTLVDQARRKKRELRMVWYDLENAFGSVLHELLWYILGLLGAPLSFIERCRGNYSDAAFVIANALDGPTAAVRLKVGVFQGCPLSPHLFTAVLTPLLLALEHLPNAGVQLSGEDRPGACAYADDLKVFSTTSAGIISQHTMVVDFLRWTGLRANPAKCRSLSLERSPSSTLAAVDLKLAVDGVPIPCLTRHEGYTYLGIGDGFDHTRSRVQLGPAITALKHDATALLQSGLAPWQVIKAVKTYLYPRIDYALRHLRPFHQQLAAFDRHLARGLRQLLHLPPQSTTEFFYAPVTRGGLGLLPLTELHGALQLAFGWQILHSPDAAIQRIARVQLRDIAAARHHLDNLHWSTRGDELCELLLNSKLGNSVHGPKKRYYSDIGSLWTDMQRHLEAFDLTFETAPALAEAGTSAAPLQLRVPHHDGWLDHRTVLRQIKMHLKYRHWRKWTAMKDQGRVARAIGGAGSSFLTHPRHFWDADYRFAIAARLNQIDTNSVLQRKRLRNHATCRHPGCAWKETLGHVLGHCKGTEAAVQGRHDKILQTISRAIEGSSRSHRDQLELLVDQTVPTLPGPALRPDLQLYNRTKRTVAIVDLAVTYEEHTNDSSSSSAMARVADQKRKKYANVKRHLERQGWRVQLSALVYGALGAVAAGNHKVLTTELGLLKREAKWLDKRNSAASVSSSRRIWAEHCSKHRRNQHNQQRGSRATETGGTPSNTGRN